METPTPTDDFALPGAPPTGRRVKSTLTGQEFIRVTPNETDMPGSTVAPATENVWRYGVWIETGREDGGPQVYGDANRMSWPMLLVHYGPLRLLPLTTQEQVEEVLYGPVGARWGEPGIPCPYQECHYGTGHVGPHRNEHGAALGYNRDLQMVPYSPDLDYCSCNQPARHKPGCPRYEQLTGGES